MGGRATQSDTPGDADEGCVCLCHRPVGALEETTSRTHLLTQGHASALSQGKTPQLSWSLEVFQPGMSVL